MLIFSMWYSKCWHGIQNGQAMNVGSDSCTSPVDTSMWHAKCWYFQCDIQNADMAFKTARQCACASLVATRSSRPKATEVHCHEKQRHRRLDQNPIWRQLRGSCLAINMSFPNQCDIENLNVNTAFRHFSVGSRRTAKGSMRCTVHTRRDPWVGLPYLSE